MSKALQDASRSVPTSKGDVRLLWLALGMFALGTDAYVVAGVLPEIAHTTMVSESLAGQLVMAFTLTYGLGAPVFAALTSRWSRTRVLVIALCGFCLANVGSTLAPTFPLLLLTRILAGGCAATHSPLAYATSTQLTPLEKRGRALALVVSGFTLATVLGSPLGTWVGEHASWRLSFALVAGLSGVACVAGLSSRLPSTTAQPALSLKVHLAPVREPHLLLALCPTLPSSPSFYLVYTYIAPLLEQNMHLSAISGLLIVTGLRVQARLRAKERTCVMKSYHVDVGAGIAGLRMREHDMPVPSSHEVLVRVRACSLSFRELMILILGYYPLPVRADVIPVSDGAGEVITVGEGVTRAKVGDRIVGAVFPHWIDGPFDMQYAAQLGGSLDGMLTEVAVLSEEALVPIPDHLSFEEAATLPIAAVTAWNALTGSRSLQAGDTVLTLGSGGVSLFALQLAKLFGARVIATTSSEEKAQRLKALGADEVINYRTTPDWHVAVRELTGGQGVDVVVEVGGPGTIEQSIKSTTCSGEIALIGSLARAGSTNGTTILSVLRSAIAGVVTLRSVAAGSRAHFLAMNRAIALHQLKPIIDRVFPFEEAQAAYRYYEEAHPFGKVVISHR